MKYRILTAGAVIVTWIVVYFLDLTTNSAIFLIPLAVLAFFQLGEKRMKRIYSSRH